MEIQTTIGEFTESIKNLNKPSNTPIKMIIEEKPEMQNDKEPYYPFLDNGTWKGEDTPIDLADNHDHYLYDEE